MVRYILLLTKGGFLNFTIFSPVILYSQCCNLTISTLVDREICTAVPVKCLITILRTTSLTEFCFFGGWYRS